jgi:hypothetical protein
MLDGIVWEEIDCDDSFIWIETLLGLHGDHKDKGDICRQLAQ